MTDYKVNFKELKARVGIDDVAYALGYRLDRKAGIGKYVEMVLGNGKRHAYHQSPERQVFADFLPP